MVGVGHTFFCRSRAPRSERRTRSSVIERLLRARSLAPLIGLVVLVGCSSAAPSVNETSITRSRRPDSPDVGHDDRPSADAPSSRGRARRIVAVGDIACAPSPCRAQIATARLVRGLDPRAVLVPGDTQYQEGTFPEYQRSYEPTWGAFKSTTYPVPGDHEYETDGGRGYYRYFGQQAHPPDGYYSFDVAGWHIVALNSQSALGQQTDWLRSDLARDRHLCELAFWHVPRWSSASGGNMSSYAPWWDVLYEAGADVVLNGHEHQYERFSKLAPNGVPASDGIREIVVGTGGAELHAFAYPPDVGSERRLRMHGVLAMHLGADRYGWQFLDTRATVRDSGTDRCHA
jgi:hypothetical protein